jgi:hypothetical protein
MSAPTQNYGVGNLILPRSGPQVIAANLDLTATAEGLVDLTTFFQQNLIAYVQGVMIDNWDGPEDIHLTVANGTGQRVIAPAGSQVWLPLFVPSGSMKFDIVAPGGVPGIVIPFYFYNIPLQPTINRKIFPAA